MSASNKPTLAPVCESANARFSDTVDFPTPPFPLATAIMFLEVVVLSHGTSDAPQSAIISKTGHLEDGTSEDASYSRNGKRFEGESCVLTTHCC